MQFTLYVDRLINPGGELLEGVRITVRDGVVSGVEDGTVASNTDIPIMSGVCSPALFNAHDHLKYTWPERIGHNGYRNSYEWLPTLYREAESKFLNVVSMEDLYWLGTYKSIFSGVTTVANHCRPLSTDFFSRFPIRILQAFRREIFVRDDPRAHKMGAGAADEARIARRDKLPFVVHIAEGTDPSTAEEVDLLDSIGGLFGGSVLVHAINVSEEQISKLASSGCSVVWCPVSNRFLFDRTAPIRSLLRSGVNVALGTDSTCTGARDLIHEMRFACGELALSLEDAARLVHSFSTINGARAFGLDNLGKIAPGYTADLVVFESRASDPYKALLEIEPRQMILVMRGGRCLLRKRSVMIPAGCALPNQSVVDVDGVEFEIAGDPERALTRVARLTGYSSTAFPLGQILRLDNRLLLEQHLSCRSAPDHRPAFDM